MNRIVSSLGVAFAILCTVSLLGCHGTRPDVVGRGFNQFADCPPSPNCVYTGASDQEHGIAAISYTTDLPAAMAQLVKVINALPRTKIVTQTENYLYVEFTSAFWRFRDDVEFSLDDAAKKINFRSASRLGRSDLGVNRKRMEAIRTQFGR
jgi:uncharacterized protein (DUF1499 family)